MDRVALSSDGVMLSHYYRVDLARIPQKLKDARQWLWWRWATRNGKPTKEPYIPGTGHYAAVDDPATWTDFETALKDLNDQDAGLGRVLTPEDGMTFSDFDDVIDLATGRPCVWARRILEQVPSYAEISPSGTGLHIVNLGVGLPCERQGRGRKCGAAEMYSSGRYMTVTGNHIVCSPADISKADLSWLFRLIDAGVFNFSAHLNLKELMLGDCSGYPSQSEADLALCSLLANLLSDEKDIDRTFRISGLYRPKWDESRGDSTYGRNTILKVMDRSIPPHVTQPSAGPIRQKEQLPIIELPRIEKENLSEWPTAALDGDYIGELTHVLTDGTAIPPQYARESIVLVLGAVVNRHLGYPSHSNLSSRRFLSVISELPAAGKGESWKRVVGQPGQLTFLGKMLEQRQIKVLDGGVVGSGQYLAQVLEENPQAIAYWDEGSELCQKAAQQASTLFSSLKKLYDGNVHWSGSFTNKKHGGNDLHLSVVMHSTRATFTRMFTGKGAVGDGLLSRFTLVHSPTLPGVPEWPERNLDEEDRLSALLVSRVPEQSLIPQIDEPARSRINDFLAVLKRPDHPHAEFVPRLDVQTKIDLLHRAVYSARNSEPRITLDLVDRPIAWAEHQLRLRRGLWTADSGDRVQAMTQVVLRRLEKGAATERELMNSANVYRDGNFEIFNRVMGALHRSTQIMAIGQTRKHTIVFALFSDADEAKP